VPDPDHVAAARQLRRERLQVVHPPVEPDVEINCSADYDTALGLDDVDGTVPDGHREGRRPVNQASASEGRFTTGGPDCVARRPNGYQCGILRGWSC
jgi:hypothetical protein